MHLRSKNMAQVGDELNQTQTRILVVLDYYDENVNSRDLRETFTDWYGSMTQQNIRDQITETLKPKGLVKKKSRSEDIGTGINANVYRITRDGKDVVDSLDRTESVGELAARVAELEDRVESFEEQADKLSQKVQQVADAESVLHESLVNAGIEITERKD